jgi:uncharacterized protein (TIGR00297 family)
MNLMQEYKTQSIYIFLGVIAFLFPLIDAFYLMVAFLAGAVIFLRITPHSPVFKMLARNLDVMSGKLIGLSHLFFTVSALVLIGQVVGFDKFPLFIIGSAFAITTFGDGLADIINIHEKTKNQIHHDDVKVYSAKSSIVFLTSGSVYAFLIGVWISDPTLQVPYQMVFFLAVIGALTGALLESMILTDDYIIIPFGSAMTMWLFYTFSYSVDTLYLVKVLVFAFFLGYLAYRARIADISAMLSAALLGVVIIVSSGVRSFFVLLAFFLLGSLFTRYRYSYKLAHGMAEKKKGVRGYKNVLSNSLVALSLAVAYGVFPEYRSLLLIAYLGSIAAACGDTLASEIGETYRGDPIMITTFKKAKAGTDGAVSTLGEGAALFGAAVIALIAVVLMDFSDRANLAIAVVAGGFIGTNIDSVLGATLQQKGYLSNNGVNLFATISGAVVSGLIYYLMGS